MKIAKRICIALWLVILTGVGVYFIVDDKLPTINLKSEQKKVVDANPETKNASASCGGHATSNGDDFYGERVDIECTFSGDIVDHSSIRGIETFTATNNMYVTCRFKASVNPTTACQNYIDDCTAIYKTYDITYGLEQIQNSQSMNSYLDVHNCNANSIDKYITFTVPRGEVIEEGIAFIKMTSGSQTVTEHRQFFATNKYPLKISYSTPDYSKTYEYGKDYTNGVSKLPTYSTKNDESYEVNYMSATGNLIMAWGGASQGLQGLKYKNSYTGTQNLSDNIYVKHPLTIDYNFIGNNPLFKSLIIHDEDGRKFDMTPTFQSSNITGVNIENNYTVILPADQYEIYADVTMQDSKAHYEIAEGEDYIYLDTGNNYRHFTGIAADGSRYNYTVNFFVEDDSILKEVYAIVDGIKYVGKIDEENVVRIKVPYTQNQIELGAVPYFDTARVSGTGKKTLYDDNNYYGIQVLGSSGNFNSYDVQIITVSANASLADIIIGDYRLDPIFNKNTTSYRVNVGNGVSQVYLEGIPENVNAKVEGIGSKTLNIGDNSFKIKVTAPDDVTTKEYTVVIHRNSADSTLSNLYIEGYNITPAFNTAVKSYNLTVPNLVTQVNIIASATSKGATITGIGPQNLKTGDNPLKVAVTAEEGNTTVYTLNVHRSTGDTTLYNLEVVEHGITPAFNSKTTSYTSYIPNGVSEVQINAIASAADATVTGAGKYTGLNVGNNNKTITVTTKAGETQVYTVNLYKKNGDSSIKSLTLNGGAVTYTQNGNNITASVKNAVNNITIAATANDTKARITGNTTTELNVGSNELKVYCYAEDSSIYTVYTITIVREENQALLSGMSASFGSGKSYNLLPTFDTYTNTYSITVPSSETTVSFAASAKYNGTTITVPTNQKLVVGQNPFRVVATNTSGDKSTYTINVIKEAEVEPLGGITVQYGGRSENLAENYKKFNITVPSDITSLTAIANIRDEENIKSITGFGTYTDLIVGNNTKHIVITTNNDNKYEYDLVIHRMSNNSQASNISLSSTSGIIKTTENFNPGIYSYKANIKENDKVINYNIALVDSNARYVVNNPVVTSLVAYHQVVIIPEDANKAPTVYNYQLNVDDSKGYDYNNDGKCDINCPSNGGTTNPFNQDTNGDGICNLNCKQENGQVTNIDTNGDGQCNINCTQINEKSDGSLEVGVANYDYNGDGICDIGCVTNDGKVINPMNQDTNNDGICDRNCDTNNDGIPDTNLYLGGSTKINQDTNGDGKCDLNCDTNGNGIPDSNLNLGITDQINQDTNGDGKCDKNCDTNGDGIPDTNLDNTIKIPVNIDTNGDGKCDLNCDTTGDGKPDTNLFVGSTTQLNQDTNGDGKCDKNCDTNNDGIPDTNLDLWGSLVLNIDTNGDGIPDLNIDTNHDGKPNLNIDTNKDGVADFNIDTTGDGNPDKNLINVKDNNNKCILNCDTNGDGLPNTNVDTTGDGKPNQNIDTTGDGKPNFNLDTTGNGKIDTNPINQKDDDNRCIKNCDTNGDNIPDYNLDMNGDGKVDTNIDTTGDGKPNINIDTTGDGKPNINIDTTGDNKPDINIDTTGDGKADLNIDTTGDGKPNLNIDTTGDGKADTNLDTTGDGKCDVNCTFGSENGNKFGAKAEKVKNSPTGVFSYIGEFIVGTLILGFVYNKLSKRKLFKKY